MKKIEVTCSKWRNGQGWEYNNSIISREKINYDTTAKEAMHEVKLNAEPNLTPEEAEYGVDYEWSVNIIDENGDIIDTASAWETEF